MDCIIRYRELSEEGPIKELQLHIPEDVRKDQDAREDYISDVLMDRNIFYRWFRIGQLLLPDEA